jgi:hypothetical protein
MSILKFSAFPSGLAIALLTPAFARADVADSAANGFTVKLADSSPSAGGLPPPGSQPRRLAGLHAHLSGDAHNLSIDDKPMGCFCEKLRAAVVCGISKSSTSILARRWS